MKILQIMPAQPGYYVRTPALMTESDDDEGHEVTMEHEVVCWALVSMLLEDDDDHRFVAPMVLDAEEALHIPNLYRDIPYPIVRADGSFGEREAKQREWFDVDFEQERRNIELRGSGEMEPLE